MLQPSQSLSEYKIEQSDNNYKQQEDKYIGFPIIIGTKSIRKDSLDSLDLKGITIIYEWEFYIRSVYTLPTIYGLKDFDYNLIENINNKDSIKKNTLDFIDKVIIHLHSSFPNPIIELTFDTSKFEWEGNEFKHKNEGWGEFEIRATLILKNNRQIKIGHFLKLHIQEPNSRIIPDNLINNQPDNVVISERFETIILKNPGDLLLQSWNIYYSDISTFNLDMEIDPDENFPKKLPSLNHWFRNKKYGEIDEKKIDRALENILDLIENNNKED